MQREIAFSTSGKAEPQVAASTPPPPTSEKRVVAQEDHNKAMSQPDPDRRTAVYDISARTVYLPNGEKLEARSGLGDKRDDPQYVHVRMRGPTPPNVYDLTLREKLFHGVRAIRLNPVDDSKMFGRDGILAHSYMLGSNGQSNGCVSFRSHPFNEIEKKQEDSCKSAMQLTTAVRPSRLSGDNARSRRLRYSK